MTIGFRAKRKKMVQEILEKYKGGSPAKYFLGTAPTIDNLTLSFPKAVLNWAVGLGMTAFTFALVYVGEMVWLWQTLSLPSWNDPEVFRRMYPLI
jgi:hypothetical protein